MRLPASFLLVGLICCWTDVGLAQTFSSPPEATSVTGNRGWPGWTAELDYLNWNVHRRGLDYAIATTDTALAVGVGTIENVEFSPDSGLRAGIAYMLGSGWEVGLRYTKFNSDAVASAVEPAGGNLWTTRSHPDRGEEATTADATARFDYDVFDLEIHRLIAVQESFAVRVFGGLRWANIDQSLEVEYDGRDFVDGVFSDVVDMTGFGVRSGGQARWRLPAGFNLFGQAAGTLMRGKFNRRLLETNLAGADTIVDVSDSSTSSVAAIELVTGLSWQNDVIGLSTGYEMVNWFDLGERSSFSSSTHEGAYDPSSTSILLDGFFIRGSLIF